MKRSAGLCGVDAARELPLPACGELAPCVALALNGTSLGDLHACAEFVLHGAAPGARLKRRRATATAGNLHTILGGAWACGGDLGAALRERPAWRARGARRPRPRPVAHRTAPPRFVPAWAARVLPGWQRMDRAGFLEPAGPNATALACPAYDGAAATARDVLARAGYLGAVRDPSTGACAVASDFVDASALVAAEGADGRCAARLAPALATDAAADDAFFALAGDVACARRRRPPPRVSESRRSDVPQANGAVGALATGAAPNDPLFWPLHPAFDRILALARLGGARLDEAWPDGTCAGRAPRRKQPASRTRTSEPLRHIDVDSGDFWTTRLRSSSSQKAAEGNFAIEVRLKI